MRTICPQISVLAGHLSNVIGLQLLFDRSENLMACESSGGDGCRSCMTWLMRSGRTVGKLKDVAESQMASGNSDAGTSPDECRMPESSRLLSQQTSDPLGGSWLVLLTCIAFVLPLIVSVITVQSIESRAGSAAAAIAGLCAAGLTAAASAGILRRITDRSAVTGADR